MSYYPTPYMFPGLVPAQGQPVQGQAQPRTMRVSRVPQGVPYGVHHGGFLYAPPGSIQVFAADFKAGSRRAPVKKSTKRTPVKNKNKNKRKAPGAPVKKKRVTKVNVNTSVNHYPAWLTTLVDKADGLTNRQIARIDKFTSAGGLRVIIQLRLGKWFAKKSKKTLLEDLGLPRACGSGASRRYVTTLDSSDSSDYTSDSSSSSDDSSSSDSEDSEYDRSH